MSGAIHAPAGSRTRVSEHAMFRYCQRVMGADIAWLKQRILHEIGKGSAKVPDGRYPIDGGRAHAIVQNNAVVTILLPEEVFKKKVKHDPRARRLF